MKKTHHIFTAFTAFAAGFISHSLINLNAKKHFQASKIIDGDTLEIDNIWHTKIRLNAIDTPERGKDFYTEARQTLEKYCLKKNISLKNTANGGFGRTAADIYCDGLFVNPKMIEMGLAIVSIEHAKDRALYALQHKARQNCRGIWSQDITKIYQDHKLENISPYGETLKITNNPSCKIKLVLN